LLVIPFVILVLATNVVGGPARGSVQRAPATDQELMMYVANQVQDAGIPGAALAIVRDGQVSFATGFGTADATGRAVTADTPFVIGSLSKPITATALMQLVDSGAVDLDASVRTYLPDFALATEDETATITVRQLLDQTSGIPTSAGQRSLNGPVTDLAAQVAALADVVPASAPGSSYAYSNANYLVLGLLIERVAQKPYGAYLEDHVFGPLGMTHAHADRDAAVRDGLTNAHRLWFGLTRDVAPLFRPDLEPAGFLMASANDLARFVAMQVGGGAIDGTRVLSSTSIEAMQRGVAAMGLGEIGRYGLGWADAEVGGIRFVGHVGSTTDMASVAFFSPERKSGMVILLNGQSTLYELAHKPDLIGMAAFELLVGREPAGTFALMYPALDVLVAVGLGYLVWRLISTVRRLRRGESVAPRILGNRLVGAILAVWLNVVVPVEVLLVVPQFLGAPWPTLVHIDIGLVLLAFAVLRLAIGAVLLVAAIQPLQRRLAARRTAMSAGRLSL
jgi:CubicO group peptidase (beta-lactamase class C family)